MASLRFWRIVVVDATSLLVLVVVLLLAPSITLAGLFVALAAGQACAIVLGVCLLPVEERWLALPPLPAQHRAVFDYGAVRALQQAVRPALLALTRIVVIALVGVAAAGQLEAGRIYTAPALLVVFGLNSFLFASYALDAKSALPAALRRADRGVLLLLAITVAFGVVAVLCVPVLGPLIAGGQYDIPVTSVVGWVVYTISVAAVTPYGALAAVRGLQAAVLAVRSAILWCRLLSPRQWHTLTGSAEWVPFGLAVGSFAGGLVIRHYVLRMPPNWSTRRLEARCRVLSPIERVAFESGCTEGVAQMCARGVDRVWEVDDLDADLGEVDVPACRPWECPASRRL